MIASRRLLAVMLMLLSQVTSGLAVLCDEGAGRQVLELLPGLCCEAAPLQDAPSDSAAAPDDVCGPCRDSAVARPAQREDDGRGTVHVPHPRAVTTLVADRAPWSGQAIALHDTTLPARDSAMVMLVARTTVLRR